MKEKRYVVYEHLFPNGKRYIGITSKEPEKRWENGFGYTQAHQSVMYNAIQKYGWENIEHNILYTNLTHQEANNLEVELIAKYKTNCKRYGNCYGYNMTDGGDGTTGHTVSQESRKIMSRRAIGRNKGFDNHKSTPVICDDKIYGSLNEFCIEHHLENATVRKWLNGQCTMPKEWFDKGLKYANKQANISCREQEFIRPIECDGMIFNSQAELSEYLHVDKPTLCFWLNGTHNPPPHIACKKIKYIDEKDYIKFEVQNSGVKKQVVFDNDIYPSQRALATVLNITPQQLSEWLNKPNKMPSKYVGRIKYVK